MYMFMDCSLWPQLIEKEKKNELWHGFLNTCISIQSGFFFKSLFLLCLYLGLNDLYRGIEKQMWISSFIAQNWIIIWAIYD